MGANPLDTVFGVPVHAIVVHFPVVLLILTAVTAGLVVLVPRSADRLDLPLLVLSGAAVVAALLAVLAGHQLADRLDLGPAIDQHRTAGTLTAWLALATFLVVLVWYRARSAPAGRTMGVVMLVVALVAAVSVTITGHLGGELVWGDVVEATDASS